MRRTSFLVILLAALCSCNGDHATTYDDVSREMDKYVADGRVAGVVTMVMKDGVLVHQHAAGFRDIEANDPLEVNDLFRIASQTKAITSVAAMILVEEGKLALDDPVSKFIPSFSEMQVAVAADSASVESESSDEGSTGAQYSLVPAEGPVTVRQLLTHTSGLSYGTGLTEPAYAAAGTVGWYLAGKDETIQELAGRIGELPLSFQPGTGWEYGYSSDVLGAVIEVESGQPLDRFYQERIFDPLGMTDTFFFVPPSEADRLVTVYGLEGDKLRRMPDGSIDESQGNYVNGPRKCFSGGAGLVSTAPDYIRFQQMLLNRGELDGVRILSAESVDQMTRDQVGEPYGVEGEGFGFGFWIVTGRSSDPSPEGSYSLGGAYHSGYWMDPQNGLVGIILTQLIPSDGSDILRRFKAMVYEVEGGRNLSG